MRRRTLLVGLWAATTVVAVLVGVFAVSTVGATIRDRGPVGDVGEVGDDGGLGGPDVVGHHGERGAHPGDVGEGVVALEGGPGVVGARRHDQAGAAAARDPSRA